LGSSWPALSAPVVLAGCVALAVGKTRFEAPGPLEREKVVSIPPRSGVRDIADLLRREGVIDEHWIIFVGGVIWLQAQSDLKSGEDVFGPPASVQDVVKTTMDGKVIQHAITLPEGWTPQ